ERDGYYIIRNVLDAGEVSALRELALAEHEKERARRGGAPFRSMLAPHVMQMPEFFRLMFRPSVVSALREIAGDDMYYVCNLTLSRDTCGLVKGRFLGFERYGWHVDSSEMGKLARFIRPDHRVVKIGIFLQDNTDEWGGGIDVVPGTHRFPLRLDNVNLSYKFKTLRDQIGILTRSIRAPIRAGDALVHDCNVQHRGTVPQKLIGNVTEAECRDGGFHDVPYEHSKLVMRWDIGRGDDVQRFFEHCVERGCKEAERGNYSVYSAMASMPETKFHPKFRRLAEEAGVDILAPDTETAERVTQLTKDHPSMNLAHLQ
ncbi:MAG: phytanoyl-CoA dioxygenase family protein, partial [Rhodospirillaceae bacterium]